MSMVWPAAAIDLADQPLFSTVSVPGNVVLDLSVEYPTADTAAYFSTTTYTPSTTFVGYFDSEKCYLYSYDSDHPSNSYFAPYSIATGHNCSSSATVPLWSGNYLNYASMQSLDIFRWVLTGGNRSVDSLSTTILQKTFQSGQDNGGDFPNKSISSSYAPGATPFAFTGGVANRVWGGGIRMWITGSGSLTGSTSTLAGSAVDWQGQNSYDTDQNAANASTVYTLYMNVKVCDPTVGLESDCKQYGANYKPEGLMQQYANQLRFAAMGYINDSNGRRDAPVLRARMKFVGPLEPAPGAPSVANPASEWDPNTGIIFTDPDSSDSAQTSSDSSAAGYPVTIAQSGVINYLNKFGYSAGTYKTYDDVSELYYAAVRYYKHLGNVAAYSSLAGAGSQSAMTNWLDGFPVLQTWDDPILYTCQQNFILGIGDVNTWNDADLPGSVLYSSTHEPSPQPPEIAADKTVDVTATTNAVGQLEGLGNIGNSFRKSGESNTDYMVGLAFDSHIKDIRPDLADIPRPQTINTYWLDVQEYQRYVANNQFFLATKYGGFTVPQGYDGTTAPTLASWHTNSDTLHDGTTTQPRPDNYFSASGGAAMAAGLRGAFAKIASETAAANSTAFSAPSPNVASTGSANYSASYDPQTWTGDLVASTVTYDTSGNPTLSPPLWHARDLLSASTVTASTRKIVTCCVSGASSPGLAFTYTALSTNTLDPRTNFASFAQVPGVATGSQSVQNYIAYLRGDTTQEIAQGGAYRTRSFRLGDIVNSKPVAVGAPQAPYFDLYNPGYAKFKNDHASRGTVVYVGANDGMLHAFNGATSGSSAGAELFAYIPSFVYGSSSSAATTGLATLGSPNYVHHYFVDATPTYADVDLDRTSSALPSSDDWRSILVGGLGKGGQGYYALDVTNPTDWTSESAVAASVLWEFTDPTMGYSYGQPLIIKTRKYGWVVVLTSGYDNADGVGYVYFVSPGSGALLEKVATPSGSLKAPVNLGPASAYTSDYSDSTADAIYVGDMLGDLWRIDISATAGAYDAPTRIAQLTDGSGNAQPVTTRPLIEVDASSGKRYVLVGTGRLLADSDISSAQTQSFYAIADGTAAFGSFYTATSLPAGESFPVTRAELNSNSDLLAGIGSAPNSPMGWYYDLPVTNGIAQRVNVDPTANGGVVAWVANQPNGSACQPGGIGTAYATSIPTGKTVLENTDASLVTSLTPSSSVLTDVRILRVAGSLRMYTGASNGNVAQAPAALSTSGGLRELSWHGVPLAQ